MLKTFKGQALRMAWFPGPADARWAMNFDAAVRKTLDAGKGELKSLTLVEGGWGAPYITVQSGLVRLVAKAGPVDVILANGPAAEFSARFFPTAGQQLKIVSLYATEGVVTEMKKGRITAMVANSPVAEARVAVDLAVRALERQRMPKTVHIPLRLITQNEIASYSVDDALAPLNLRMPLPKLPPVQNARH
ncbi:hypothetical protein [Duganella radicis]|uniref:hypothetical protein n=1 Tax=Duganella radicis TaxID=551988 RepID=UPI0014795604|nr:hypothetical protein [Duganella radicis]